MAWRMHALYRVPSSCMCYLPRRLKFESEVNSDQLWRVLPEDLIAIDTNISKVRLSRCIKNVLRKITMTCIYNIYSTVSCNSEFN